MRALIIGATDTETEGSLTLKHLIFSLEKHAVLYDFSHSLRNDQHKRFSELLIIIKDVKQTQQYRVMPLLVAMMRTGDKSLSRARFRKEKHSMSSI